MNTDADLVGDPAVGPRVPRDHVLDQLLHPSALLRTEIFSRETHVPVGARTQHGEEGHEVTSPVHRELRRGSSSPGAQTQA